MIGYSYTSSINNPQLRHYFRHNYNVLSGALVICGAIAFIWAACWASIRTACAGFDSTFIGAQPVGKAMELMTLFLRFFIFGKAPSQFIIYLPQYDRAAKRRERSYISISLSFQRPADID